MSEKEKKDMLNSPSQKEDIGNSQNKRGYSHRYGENVVDNDIRQKEKTDKQTKDKHVEQKRRYGVEEENNNRKLINDEISEEVADRVYNREPKEKQMKEQTEQESAAAKKLAEQKIDTSESETSKEKVVSDALEFIKVNITRARAYLDGEYLERTTKFERCMEIFDEAVFSGKIIMNEEQTETFIAFGKHDKVVDVASAKDYVDFAFTRVLPFITGIAIVAGVALGVEQPLSGLNKINSLLSSAPSVGDMDKLTKIGDLGGNLLR